MDDPQRGFSVLGDGPLDMRMDPQVDFNAFRSSMKIYALWRKNRYHCKLLSVE